MPRQAAVAGAAILIAAFAAVERMAADPKEDQSVRSGRISDIAVRTPFPEYPPAAQSKGQRGDGIFQITLGTNGNVTKVAVIKSTGHADLDTSAMNALRRWQFKPATRIKFVKVPISFGTDRSEVERLFGGRASSDEPVTGTNIRGYRPSRLYQGLPY